jgi:hypothetical protein
VQHPDLPIAQVDREGIPEGQVRHSVPDATLLVQEEAVVIQVPLQPLSLG